MELHGTITFLYYEDIDHAERFYADALGFQKVIDVGFARVFRVSDGIHVGIVDGARGHLKASAEKPVMLSWFTGDIDAWHRRLKERGVAIEQPPREADYLHMKTMLFRDPEGYTLEVLQWLTEPYGIKQ